MRLFMHKAAYERVRSRLPATGLEIVTIDEAGACELAGKAVAAAGVAPEIVWMTGDLLRTRQMGAFFDMALQSPGVKWLQTFNTGLDDPRYRAVYDRGIRMTNSDAQAVAIAEYVMAKVSAEWYPLAVHSQAQARHEWVRATFRELSQSRWLIVGFGNIGREIARRARAFGAKVAGVRRNATPDPLVERMGTLSDLLAMLPAADVVVLAATHNRETDNLADAGFFTAMKPGAILVNIARGGLIVDAALFDGLALGAPKVAILDVFRDEPLPADSPFWSHPQIRVTAHNSASGSGTMARGDELFLENLGHYLAGEPLRNLVGEKHF